MVVPIFKKVICSDCLVISTGVAVESDSSVIQ